MACISGWCELVRQGVAREGDKKRKGQKKETRENPHYSNARSLRHNYIALHLQNITKTSQHCDLH